MTMRLVVRLSMAAAVGLGGWTIGAGCGSAADDGSSAFGGGSGKGGSGGGQGGGFNNDGGGAFAAGGGDGGGGGIDTDVGGDTACAGESKKAEKTPVDIYMMFDKSGSMVGNKWNGCKSAMLQFVQNPKTVGLGFGLQYFPIGSNCNVNEYATPAVPIAPLPGNAGAITNSLNATSPNGSTPTLPAEQGAIVYLVNFLKANPTHKGVVVLVTDGYPNICNSTVPAVASAAQQGANGNPKIPTFVVGVQDASTNLQALDQIAAAGGTQKAFLVNDANAAQQFLDALLKIAGTILACEYAVPVPSKGQIDPGKTNVDYTPGNGGPPETFGKVANEAACGGKADAFYFDDEQKPTKVLLCPETCKKVSADTQGSIAVRYGCSGKVF